MPKTCKFKKEKEFYSGSYLESEVGWLQGKNMAGSHAMAVRKQKRKNLEGDREVDSSRLYQ